jgi:hypothetical protein
VLKQRDAEKRDPGLSEQDREQGRKSGQGEKRKREVGRKLGKPRSNVGENVSKSRRATLRRANLAAVRRYPTFPTVASRHRPSAQPGERRL